MFTQKTISTTIIMSFFLSLVGLPILGNQPPLVQAGPLAYGICQTGCNAVAVACYGAAGVTMGTITFGAGIAPAVMACAAAQGTCMAACVAAGLSPTP